MEQQTKAIETTEEAIKKAETELALKEFGLELKRVRENKGINQKELAEITHIHRTVISELERGIYTPSLIMIGQLSEGLGINPHILLAAYYGIPLPEFDPRDKETLENFIKLALEYTTQRSQETAAPTTQTPQQNLITANPSGPITEKGEEGLRKGVGINRRNSAARRKAETPEHNDIDK